ncbi:SUMF1/EgtB/PvdO family nonheme iron enzyme [candidate division KSB1 bacterium]|nr:SUMF1/EgtB/PvdO family nonheme iron enzyme [candidate division KSB1 bacterium]
MSGNVYEWCLTKWRENYQAVEDNTTTGEDLRVVRGGSYINYHYDVRCSCRLRSYPDYTGLWDRFSCGSLHLWSLKSLHSESLIAAKLANLTIRVVRKRGSMKLCLHKSNLKNPSKRKKGKIQPAF